MGNQCGSKNKDLIDVDDMDQMMRMSKTKKKFNISNE